MLLKPKTVNRVVLIPVDSIYPNPNQPRRVFEPEKISELAASIAEYGLLQPITVQQFERNTYQLVAGERRLLACRQLQMEEIPAIITQMEKENSAALALIENIQRCSLNYFE
jgi:ParB family chromosome partitioning protein